MVMVQKSWEGGREGDVTSCSTSASVLGQLWLWGDAGVMLQDGTCDPRKCRVAMGTPSPASARGRARPAVGFHQPSPIPSLPQWQRGAPASKLKPNQKFSFQRTQENVFPNKTVLNKVRAAGGRLLRQLHFAAFI